ncbi:MAG: hypothetical protein ACLFVW_05525 [Phycisphaerae bacterium]
MQLVCGYCGWTIDADGREPGEVMACPRCGRDVRVPRLTGDDDCEPVVGFAEQAREAMKNVPTARVTCGGCGHSFTVGLRMCGRAVRCPSCGAAVRIPYPEDTDTATPASSGHDGERSSQEANDGSQPSEEPGKRRGDARSRRGWVRVLLAVAVLVVAAFAAVVVFL